jgi:hypothetical protein
MPAMHHILVQNRGSLPSNGVQELQEQNHGYTIDHYLEGKDNLHSSSLPSSRVFFCFLVNFLFLFSINLLPLRSPDLSSS